jgi:hypothetical protein
MRALVAGVLGGIVFFIWGAVAHMVLPIGQMGMREASAEDPVIAAMKDNLPGAGVYMVPGLSPQQMEDKAAVQAYSAKAKANPYAFIVYQPVGEDGTDMGDNLAKQAATDVLSGIVVAWVLSLGVVAFRRRVIAAAALGLFSWLTISAPYWNWYRFPTDFTVASLLEQVVGWLLAGVAIAWWLGRREA